MRRGAFEVATRDFNQALLALATVVGAYFGAAALDIVWAFWALFGLSLGYAGLRWLIPGVRGAVRKYRDLITRGRDHPRLMRVAAEHQARAEQLEAEKRALQLQESERYKLGVVEGRRRAIGELLASQTAAQLEPTAIAIQDDELMLAAKPLTEDLPVVGSRWLLAVKGMDSIKGICTVREISPTLYVRLSVDQALDVGHLTALRGQAELSSDFPPSLELRVRPFEEVQDLEQEMS